MVHVMSCYEKLRLQNIERNQLFMKQLGFEPAAPIAAEIKEKKAKRKVEHLDYTYELRRSHRLASVPALIHVTEDGGEEAADEEYLEKKFVTVIRRPSIPGKQLPPPSDSSRAKNADLDFFFGPSQISLTTSGLESISNAGMLGEPIAQFGKAAVMAAANHGNAPKFSKYSGVCEWNNCVFLWVNVMKKVGAGYGNTFNEEGRFMTWFGGSKMSSDSAVVKRLLSSASRETLKELNREEYVSEQLVKCGYEDSNNSNTDEIILFVRIEGESYACMGRVAYISFNVDIQPIEFEWELLDYQQIKDKPLFKRIQRT